MADKVEIAEKERRVREFLGRHDLGGALFLKQSSFAWMTCGGDNHVTLAGDRGASSLLVTREAKYVLADRIEAARMMEEEALEDQGFHLVTYEWHEADPIAEARMLCPGPLVFDVGMPGDRPELAPELHKMRWSLLLQEVERYREVGKLAGEAMQAACLRVERGWSEHEIAGVLAKEMMDREIIPYLVLVAADERIYQYRHAIPTGKRLDKHAMLVICAEKWGLIVSLTRFVHFGAVPSELRKRQLAVARIDAAFIAGTRPGAKVGEIFEAGLRAYAESGYPDEWLLHHQGGATGYEARNYKAVPGDEHIVEENQAFAWNPSITGAKSEDTIIALSGGPEVISPTPLLPEIVYVARGKVQGLTRPDVLEKV